MVRPFHEACLEECFFNANKIIIKHIVYVSTKALSDS